MPVYIITAFHQDFFDELKEAEEKNIKFELLKKPLGIDSILLVAKSILEQPLEI